jgi:hypothetical protein
MRMSALDSWLRHEGNSRSREFLSTARVIHDLMTAAAAADYDLLIYTPTVDRDGFDLILDDRDLLLPLQLKSVIKGGKAPSWSIHRHLLRPDMHDVELYGFESSPSGAGRGGGVLLLSLEPSGAELSLRYRYTDIDVLSALWSGLIRLPSPSVRRLQALRTALESEPGGKVAVPRSAFLTARSPEHLLALAGLNSRARAGEWPAHLRLLLAHENLPHRPPLPAPAAIIRKGLLDALAALVTERTAA